MKNIAIIIGHLSYGGAEKQLYLLCKGINRQKYNPLVFCLSREAIPWGDRLSALGIKVYFIRRLSSYDPTRVLRLAYLFYIHKIEIILSFLHIGNVYSCLSRVLYFRNSRHVAQVRSRESSMRGITKRLNMFALRSSDSVVVNSGHLAKFAGDFFRIDPEKIHTIYNGIELTQSTPKPAGKEVHMGIIGKDTKDKNIQLFLDTGRFLLEKYNNIILHLCGRGLGADNRFLPGIPGKFQEKIRFHGELEDTSGFLEDLDIYLSTSNSEGLPNAVMEAMSIGLPVVATDVGGVADLVQHGKTGYLVPAGDLERLTHYCEQFITHTELRLAMGKKAREFICVNFSYKKMARQYEKIFDGF